jgi:two-component system NtrC family response regulator
LALQLIDTPNASGPQAREGSQMLVGQHIVMEELRSQIARVAQTQFTVLIEGESGVGKELVAREIHLASRRRRGPFIAINCAAIVETLIEAELFGIEDRTATGVRGRRGKFELADGGTLFLDEVADLSPMSQAKLLRVLQDLSVERVGGTTVHHVNVRVLAATNRNLRRFVDDGRFRLDLYYRLSGVELYVPPLRARRSDIPLLIRHFADRSHRGHPMKFTPAAIEALMTYDWPGNVRQLERVLERAIALSTAPTLGLHDLPEEISREYRELVPQIAQSDTSLRAWSSRYVRLVLERCEGNKTRACNLLNISFHTLKTHLAYGSATAADDPAAAPNGVATPQAHAEPGSLEVRSPTAG